MPRISHVIIAGGLLAALGYAAVAGPEASAADAAAGYHVTAIRSVGKHKGDYLPAHRYKLFVDGALVGGFKDVQGLEADFTARKMPGRTSYQPIALLGGFVADPSVLPTADGSEAHESVRYTLLDRGLDGAERRLDFTGYPIRVTSRAAAHDVAAIDGLDVAVETIVFSKKVADAPHRGEVK